MTAAADAPVAGPKYDAGYGGSRGRVANQTTEAGKTTTVPASVPAPVPVLSPASTPTPAPAEPAVASIYIVSSIQRKYRVLLKTVVRAGLDPGSDKAGILAKGGNIMADQVRHTHAIIVIARIRCASSQRVLDRRASATALQPFGSTIATGGSARLPATAARYLSS